jgi:hypothetical protein
VAKPSASAKKKPARKPVKPKPKPKPKAMAKRKPKAVKVTAKPKTKPKAKGKAKPRKPAVKAAKKPAAREPAARRPAARKPAAKPPRSGAGVVTEIAGADDPVGALTRYADSLGARIPAAAAQTLLGATTLTLAGLASERGGDRPNAIVDLILSLWSTLPDPDGYHAQQVLQNAAASVVDPDRMAAIETLVPPDAASGVLFNLACGWAIAGDRRRMVRTLERALAAGVSPAKVRGDADFSRVLDDPEVERVLASRKTPEIPVDVTRHLEPIRAAVERATAALRAQGDPVMLGTPASLADVLAAELVAGVQLPNDFRALLTLHDGMSLGDDQYLGTRDLRGGTPLHRRAREYIEMSSRYGMAGIDDCVPLSNRGEPNNWLLYDPFGPTRETGPGYVVMLTADARPYRDLAEVFDMIAKRAGG